MKSDEFYLGDGWYGLVEWSYDNGIFKGTMSTTSECSINSLWEEQFEVMNVSEEIMLDYCRKYIIKATS